MKKEEWKKVVGFEGYEISNLGRVKSLKQKKERILKSTKDTTGYLIVGLSNNNVAKTKRVHQLVAIAFLGHKPCGLKLVVDHIDNNPLNNNLDNLQITTQSKNIGKRFLKIESDYKGVFWSKARSKWASIIVVNGKNNYLGFYNTELEASESYNNFIKTL
jgi:hypothetical protein